MYENEAVIKQVNCQSSLHASKSSYLAQQQALTWAEKRVPNGVWLHSWITLTSTCWSNYKPINTFFYSSSTHWPGCYVCLWCCVTAANFSFWNRMQFKCTHTTLAHFKLSIYVKITDTAKFQNKTEGPTLQQERMLLHAGYAIDTSTYIHVVASTIPPSKSHRPIF